MDNNEQLINELSLLRKAAERIADALEDIEENLEIMVLDDDDSFLDELLSGLEDEDFEEFDDFDDNDEFDDDDEEEEGDEEE